MSEWIPLLQGLIWPIFIALLVFLTRAHIASILRSISTRIERGDPFQAGPSGISLGQVAPKLTRLDEVPEGAITVSPSDRVLEGTKTSDNEVPIEYSDVIYLIHSVSAPFIDNEGVERHLVKVIVDVDSDELLDKVERVVYFLHPTFPQPKMEVTDRKRNFELQVRPWGEFNLTADVHIKGYKAPLKLQRYLNFRVSLPSTTV